MTEIAKFSYISWQEKYLYEKPYQVFAAIGDKEFPTSNLVFEDGPLETVHDARGREHEFSLESQGFTFVTQTSDPEDWSSVELIESKYLPQMEALLRECISGIDKVCFFDWRIRRDKEVPGGIIDGNDRMQHFLPARHVHIDQTPSAVLGRVLLHLPDDAEKLMSGRVRIVNLWRPMCEVVEDRPLAICDVRTVSREDIVESDHVRRHYTGSNYYNKYSDKYKWYFLSRQKRDEVTLVQMFDSAADTVSGCPHSSFEPKTIPKNASKRESLEVRALIFTAS